MSWHVKGNSVFNEKGELMALCFKEGLSETILQALVLVARMRRAYKTGNINDLYEGDKDNG